MWLNMKGLPNQGPWHASNKKLPPKNTNKEDPKTEKNYTTKVNPMLRPYVITKT